MAVAAFAVMPLTAWAAESNVEIVAQPQGGGIELGESLSLSVTAKLREGAQVPTGAEISYQWYNADGEITGATTSTLSVREPGTYYVEAWAERDAGGERARSNDAVVTMYIDVPLIKLVEQDGDVAPGAETFRFEIFEMSAQSQYTLLSDSIQTDGEGDFEGALRISFTSLDDLRNLAEGFKVREIAETKDGWEYSDAEWYVGLTIDPDVSSVDFFFCEVIDGNPQMNDPQEAMLFVNTYTAADAADADKSDAADVPQTGDHANTLGWVVTAIASVSGACGLMAWKKRRQVNGTW
ncbi:MAG: hypothetical protein FWE94_06035 [Coriobacteriia bacterium]|nr:hypothetical protein [Coriobacteriia bacterium]